MPIRDLPARVGLCAIMKDEFPYLLEWIAYHRLIGFDPITIYSNDCTDGSVEALDILAQRGVVIHRVQRTTTLKSPQHLAYRDALERAETEWIGFLDADEFLVLKRDRDVGGFVAGFDASVSAIAVHWRIFGSSGHLRFQPDPVIERFTRASVKDHSINTHFKSLVRVADVERMDVHWAKLKSGAYANASGTVIPLDSFGRTKPVATECAQINHYCVKSPEEFEGKKRRGATDRPLGDPAKWTLRSEPNFREYHDRNEEEDLSLFAIRDEVKAQMAVLRTLLVEAGFVFFK